MIPSYALVAFLLRRSRESQGITSEEAARRYSVSPVDVATLELCGSCQGINIMEYAETVLSMDETELKSLSAIMAKGLE